jgi:hypothetical protein
MTIVVDVGLELDVGEAVDVAVIMWTGKDISVISLVKPPFHRTKVLSHSMKVG